MPAKPDTESGAPAALARLATQEVAFAKEVLKAEEALLKVEGEFVEGDEVAERHVRKAKIDYDEALKRHWQVAKLLLPYDKSVDQSRREGAKIPQAEAEEFAAQLFLTLDLAIESYISSLSQEATRAESPEQFYLAHADCFRAAKESAITQAKEQGAIPKWALRE